MTISYAMLLDGGFIRYRLPGRNHHVDAPGISAFARAVSALPCLQGMRLHRVYFYDSKPLEAVEAKPLGGGTIDFGSSATALRNRKLHQGLAREPFFALRFGDLALEGWRLQRRALEQAGAEVTIGPDDLEPNIRQKGVDMRIGLDIASLTLKKHVQVIVLATGDSDFIPAMKFARREGAQLILLTLGHGVKEGLREHADLVIDQYPFAAPPGM
jgi:uncharacterized LabA/DUF88 family protein